MHSIVQSVETTILVWGKICKCVTHSDVNFWPITWRAWVRVSQRPSKLSTAILVHVFRFCKCVVFFLGLLLTRRWKLVEVFMTVIMYWSPQRGRRGQRIVTSLIIYKQQFLQSDWLRTCQLIPNQWSVQFHQCKKVKLSAKRWNWVQNSKIKNDWQLWQNWARTNKMADKNETRVKLFT